MHWQTITKRAVIPAALAALALLAPAGARAHCDTMDGPVVKAGQKALASGNVNLVLIWVQPADEAELRQSLAQAREVRKLGPAAEQLADRYFLETLVRLHRAGEGAPYTGLKPAGLNLGAAIPAADRALEGGALEPLVKLATGAVEQGLRREFERTRALAAFDPNDVAAGRKYVGAYVEFIHYVERIYAAAERPAPGHYAETEARAEETAPH